MNKKRVHLTLAIIGMGPRGLMLLERMIAHASLQVAKNIKLYLFEPNMPGSGCHHLAQPDYLLLNTIAKELTIFPTKEMLAEHMPPSFVHAGPTFFEWCKQNNHGMTELSETAYLPRKYMGAYLQDAYRRLLANLPDNLSVCIYKEYVKDITVNKTSGRVIYQIHGMARKPVSVDKLFICTGHGVMNQTTYQAKEMVDVADTQEKTTWINPYHDIQAKQRVLIQGLGLSAVDIINMLTVGRQGKYILNVNQTLQYIPSGYEPKLYLYSRTGLPFRSRPMVSADRKQYKPYCLTQEKIKLLTCNALNGRLDFDNDILPLLYCEMRIAYYQTKARLFDFDGVLDEQAIQAFFKENISLFGLALEYQFDTWLMQHESGYDRFDPKTCLLFKLPNLVHEANYEGWISRFIYQDCLASKKGILASPEKAAIEIFRDLRENIRDMVNFGGLTAVSRTHFFEKHSQLFNRLVAGPHYHAYEQLLALVEAGVVHFVYPEAVVETDESIHFTYHANYYKADRLIKARISAYQGAGYPSLLKSLQRQGEIDLNLLYARPSINVDKRFNPVLTRHGMTNENIFLLGTMIEGNTYYNHYIPSPGVKSRAFIEADQCVRQLLNNTHHHWSKYKHNKKITMPPERRLKMILPKI